MTGASEKSIKGQGATEYLIILAGVLVIAVLVVSILGYFPGFSGGITESESATYWQSVARPIRVLEATTDNCACAVCSGNGAYRMVVQNSQSSPITLTEVITDNGVAGTATTQVCNSDGVIVPITLNPGKSVTIAFNTAPGAPAQCPPLTPGKRIEVALTFKYTHYGLANISQVGEKKLVLRCRKQDPGGAYLD